MKSRLLHRALVFCALLMLAPAASALTWKEWLFRIFGIDKGPYEKLVVVRDDPTAIFPTGNALVKFSVNTGKLATLWKSEGLLSPLLLRSGRIAVLRRSPAGQLAETDGIWTLAADGGSPRHDLRAPRLAQILGEDADGRVIVAQQLAEEPDAAPMKKLILQLADLKEGVLRDPPEVKKEINLETLASLPRAGRVQGNRLLAKGTSGGLSVARLQDNPSGEFEPLGPKLSVPIIDPVWAGEEAVLFVTQKNAGDD